jgi:hypothetical protein
MRDWVSTLNSLSSRKKRRLPAAATAAAATAATAAAATAATAAEPSYEVPEWMAEILYQTSPHYLPIHPPKFTFTTGENTETSSSQIHSTEEAEQFLSTY